MDDDGSKKLDFDEFKKGIHDYGLLVEDAVSNNTVMATNSMDTMRLEITAEQDICWPICHGTLEKLILEI